ncbi:MAG: SHOCT domain-containing protein [Candidatus Bathyarchaeia archaeon]
MVEKKGDLILLLIILVVLIGILPILLWGLWRGYMSGMMGMMGYGWGFMFLIPIAFLVLIALGAYYLITEFSGTGRPSSGGSRRALEILGERYAKGEITREQYLRMKEELES